MTSLRPALTLLLALAALPGRANETPATSEPAALAALRAKAERGNGIAQYNLGLAYQQGRGVSADAAEAFVWLTLAGESGSTGKALDTLLPTMTPDQIADGRRRLEARRTGVVSAKLPGVRPGAAPKSATSDPVSAPPPAAPDEPVQIGPPSPAVVADELRAQLKQTQSALTAQSAELATARAEAGRLRAARDEARPQASAAEATATQLEAARRELADLRRQLAATQEKLAAATRDSSATSTLEARVRALESEKSALAEKLAHTETAMSSLASASAAQAREEVARATSAKKDAEEKLALALRSYSVLEQERNDLAGKLAATPTRPSEPARPTPAADLAAARAELEIFRTRAAAAEHAASSAQAELARLKQTLAATPPPPAANNPPPPAPSETAAPATPSPAAVASVASASASPPPGPPASTAEPRLHTIALGETLSAISLKYYGTTKRWPEILAANRDLLRDERSMVAGRVLRIP